MGFFVVDDGRMGKKGRVGYPSDVSDEEWAFVVPYLLLCREDAPQREYSLRAVFNGLRYLVRTGCQWRYLPHDLPPWPVVYQQTQRWIESHCFETMVEDLRLLLREFTGRKAQPTAMLLDSRTIQSTPESGARAGYDGAKRRKGSKVHAAVDTLGHLLALRVTPADEQDRAQVGELARQVQLITGEHVELAYVDQGYNGQRPKRQRPSMASGSRWSSTPRPSEASCCCRAAGSSNEASHGQRDSADSPVTMNDSTPRSKAFICSLSQLSCSAILQIHSNEVPNSL